MSIWTYNNDTQRKPTPAEVEASSCTFCQSPLDRLGERAAEDSQNHIQQGSILIKVFACPACGWWKAIGSFDAVSWNQDLVSETRCSIGSLVDLAVDLPTLPVEEIRRYLLARFEKRFEIHPRLVEETVAAVFRDLAYEVELTAYSKDGGNDLVVLQSSTGVRAGVQIKRTKNTIGVAQIREFAGALLFEGLTEGIFVTTSSYTAGARELEERSAGLIPITLRDASWLYEALRLTQRPAYRSLDQQDAPWATNLATFSLLHLIHRYNAGFANE